MEVIKQIKTKSSSGYSSPTYLGAEQRFVGALRQCNLDNLEEQSLLGVDCVTTEYWQSADNAHIIIKEFHDGSQSTNYYKLETTIYEDKFINSNITTGVATVSDFENIASSNTDYVTVRIDTLYFVVNASNIIKVATKTTQQKCDNEKYITKEVIVREK